MVSKRVQSPAQSQNHLDFRYGSERRRIYFIFSVPRTVIPDHGGEGSGRAGGGGCLAHICKFEVTM